MLNQELLNPNSIVVVGGSNDIRKPGGKILKNILDGGFDKDLRVVNLKDKNVQGVDTYSNLSDLPDTDLAILAISVNYCLETVRVLTEQKNTKAFIIISAGFAEAGKKGKQIENEIVSQIEKVNGCLIGPNCIGVLNQNYKGVFTTPIPEYSKNGCDLISGSGATALFIIEAGIPLGVKFANVFSVGNSAQIRVEDVLEYMDLHFDPKKDPRIKLLYIESLTDPKKLLKHTSSLIKKGAKIAAIKAGSTAEGSRAATSHTGAIATSDITVRALFKKAGIVYCSSREELLSVASIFKYKKLKGKNIAIITHAGGSAVMLADELSKDGLKVPALEGKEAKKLKSFLNPGSSVANPIDFLATGTAEQLGIIIDYCEHKFDNIDGMVVVFGSPGLFDVENAYNVLSVKLDICKKPIYPVLPSLINARDEISSFLAKGNINFPDEVVLGKALAQVYNTHLPETETILFPKIDKERIRRIIDESEDGFLDSKYVAEIVDSAGIPRVKEVVSNKKDQLLSVFEKKNFPLVMKVQGFLHKSDVNGVIMNITSMKQAAKSFDKLMRIENATGVLAQPMLNGLELFIGVKREKGFDHTILCGLGGVFVEILKDVSAGLSPLSIGEIKMMVQSLRGYELLKGVRGKKGVNEDLFMEIIQRVSALVEIAPEIVEMDMNPLIGTEKKITTVDVRIRIQK